MNSSIAPTWYWKNGLHDALICHIEFVSLEYDYTKSNPIRNYLIIELDSRAALYDTSVKAIKFYNAKVLSSMTDYANWWWVSDSLIKNGGKYFLKICIASPNQNDALLIQFDNAEIIR